jgi:hypothetical protein
VEETPEQVLARLVRYRDSLNREASNGAASNGAASKGGDAGGTATATAPPSPVLRLRTAAPDSRSAALAGASRPATEVGRPDREWSYSSESKWHHTRNAVPATVFGQFLAVLACTLVVVAFERFASTIALEIAAAAAVVGLIAAVRRVPLALWWTFGVVLGGVLGRLS